MKGKGQLDEHLANNILLNEKMNMLRWANPSMAPTWEEEIYGPKGDIEVGSVNHWNAIARVTGCGNSGAFRPQCFIVKEFKTYQANSKELVVVTETVAEWVHAVDAMSGVGTTRRTTTMPKFRNCPI
ncbi:uncharacterized protein V1513DRAFT_427705 [Lipomyces chichibuensis]|uniref:uncharacterized protein n=1 Tax=Lipomyces chichibuensis TaxID=1546026 RepID=UPI0033441F25